MSLKRTPEWIDKQGNSRDLEEELDKKLNSADTHYSNWKSYEGDKAQGVPYICEIGPNSALGGSSKAWGAKSGDYYQQQIQYSEHGKGLLPSKKYLPRVKTYIRDGNTLEEVYDSAKIDSSNGTIYLEAASNQINYVVVVY